MDKGKSGQVRFEDLRRLAAGFQPAKLFITALELGFFDALQGGGLTAVALAGNTGTDPRAAAIVANALVSLGLLTKKDGLYSNSEASARWLVKGAPEYRGSVISHLGNTWEDWADLADTIKTGTARCRRKKGDVPADPGHLEAFIMGMENITRDIAPLIAERLPLEGRKAILDVGGGPGNYCLAFARRAPDARVVHFDLPGPGAVARKFVAGQREGHRIEFVSGNFHMDSLGSGFDFVWLSQVIHMMGEDDVARLVKKTADAMLPGGVLAIHDHFLNDDMASPVQAAVFGVHMLAATTGGRTYSLSETEKFMEAAGLKPEGRIDYGGPARIVLGGKK